MGRLKLRNAGGAGVVALCAAVVLVVGGCGGGDSTAAEKGSAPVAVTKPAFIKKADAICRHANLEQEAGLKTYLITNPNPEPTKLVDTIALPPLETEMKQLHKLRLPDKGRRQIEDIFKEFEVAMVRARKEPAAALESLTGPFHHVEVVAANFGFESCGQF